MTQAYTFGPYNFDASGNLKVNIAAGSVSVGTVQSQGQFNTTLPTLTDGTSADLQTDNRGRLLTVNAGPLGDTAPAASLAVTNVAATGVQTSVASLASSVSVLASNVARKGATVFNDSTAILYLLLVTGGTASTTAYTVQLVAGAYYEVPFGYTGALIGIWAAANGNARVTEFTA